MCSQPYLERRSATNIRPSSCCGKAPNSFSVTQVKIPNPNCQSSIASKVLPPLATILINSGSRVGIGARWGMVSAKPRNHHADPSLESAWSASLGDSTVAFA